MKYLIGIVIIVGLALGCWQIHQYWEEVNSKNQPAAAPAAPPPVSGEQLPGLPPELEGPLQTAEDNGARALKDFLQAHRKEIKDPRLAWIELDYVVIAGASDPGEARRVFNEVRERLAPGSPVYPRMQQLAKTYE